MNGRSYNFAIFQGINSDFCLVPLHGNGTLAHGYGSIAVNIEAEVCTFGKRAGRAVGKEGYGVVTHPVIVAVVNKGVAAGCTYGHGITGHDVSGYFERKVKAERCVVLVRGSQHELARYGVAAAFSGNSCIVGEFRGAAPCRFVHGSGGLRTCKVYTSGECFAVNSCNFAVKVKLYAVGYAVNDGGEGKPFCPLGVLLVTNLRIAVFEPVCIEGNFCLYIFFGKVESDGLFISPAAECLFADFFKCGGHHNGGYSGKSLHCAFVNGLDGVYKVNSLYGAAVVKRKSVCADIGDRTAEFDGFRLEVVPLGLFAGIIIHIAAAGEGKGLGALVPAPFNLFAGIARFIALVSYGCAAVPAATAISAPESRMFVFLPL